MTRLQINTPLFNKKARGQKATYLQRTLLYLRAQELMESNGTTTKDIAENLKMNYNTANTVLHRMKKYEYLSGKKTTVTYYRYQPLMSDEINEDTIYGDDTPEHISYSDIIKRKRKKLIIWTLTNKGRNYAKYIWYNPYHYNLSDELEKYNLDVLFHGNLPAEFFLEEKKYHNDELHDLYKQKEEIIYISPIEYKEMTLDTISDPKEKLHTVMEIYFEKNDISYARYFSEDFEYLITRPNYKINKIRIKTGSFLGGSMNLTSKDKKFLEKDENNQICLVTPMLVTKPIVISFISFENGEDDKDIEIKNLREEVFSLKLEKMSLESRIRMTEKLYDVALKQM